MKLGLELMTVVSTYGFNSEREFINHVVNKVNRTGLIVLLVDFQSPNTRAIINRGVLKVTLHQYFGPFKSRIFDYINAVLRRFRHEEIAIYRRANCVCT